MTSDTCLAIASACLGVMSGWHFCKVTLQSSAKEIHAEAWPTYDFVNGGKSAMLVAQAANTFTGGVLLLLTFGLQVAEKAAPSFAMPSYFGWVTGAASIALAMLLGKSLTSRRATSLTAAVREIQASKGA